MSGLTFDRARERVRAGEDAATVAADFVTGLTLAEKLECLDGDEEFWPGLMRLAGAAVSRAAAKVTAHGPVSMAAAPRSILTLRSASVKRSVLCCGRAGRTSLAAST